MMKSKVFTAAVVVFLLCDWCMGDPQTQIWYETTDLGLGRWECTYDVENISLSVPIEEFTIWFDYDLYDNLIVTTQATPAGWDQSVWQREPVLLDDGGFDAAALVSGIDISQIVGSFSVSFDWLGTGRPGSQYYEIIDPTDYHTIEDGWTVPEPATLCLLGLGGLALLRREHHE